MDAVDEFLFVRHQGFCENIASAMALLLRAVGVPTRVVTGFGPGSRNAFTGYYDVRESDAHAWVEVLYPAAGWVQYDPTFGVPPANPGLASRFVAPQVIAAAGRFVARIIPGPVKDAARQVGSWIVAAAKRSLVARPLTVVALALVTVAAIAFRRRRRARPGRRRSIKGATRAFVSLSGSLGARGLGRSDQQTPRNTWPRSAAAGNCRGTSFPKRRWWSERSSASASPVGLKIPTTLRMRQADARSGLR